MIDQECLWNIAMLAAGDCLLHNKTQTPVKPPSQVVVDNESNRMIVHGGFLHDTMFFGKAWGEPSSGVWQLDLKTVAWSRAMGVLLSHPRKVLVLWEIWKSCPTATKTFVSCTTSIPWHALAQYLMTTTGQKR